MSGQVNDTIDLRAILRKILSKWWLFVITGAISLALGVVYIKTTARLYQVKTVVMMSEKSRNTLGGGKDEFLKGSSFLSNTSDVEDQIVQLTSITNTTKALQRLEFGISYFERKNFLTQEKFEYPPFFVKLDTVAVQVYGTPIRVSVDREAGTYRVQAQAKHATLYNVQKQVELEGFIPDYNVDVVTRIGEPFVAEGLSFSIEFPEDRVYGKGIEHHFTINSLDALVAEYRAKTAAVPIGDESNIVEVSTVGEVVAKEKQFLNKLVETFIESELLRRQQKGRRTINFIEQQIGSVSDSLKQVQSNIQSIRSSSTVFNVGQSADVILTDRSRLEDERSQWERKRLYCQQILQKLRSNDDFRNVPAPQSSGIDDAVLNNTVLELTRLAADLAAQNVSSGGRSSPTIIAMERRIRNLQSSLVATAEGLVEQAEISINDITRRLGSLSYQLGQLGRVEGDISSSQRDFELSGNLYNYLMEKKYEASIAVASDQVDKFVIDDARIVGGKPVKPSKKVVLGGALLLGLLLPLGFILVRDFFNDTITDLDQLKRLSPLPVLATIPSSRRKRVMPDEPKSLLAESFRTARINLQYLNSNSERQVVGFTSSTSGEGKTFCAVNLATVMALSGKRTLILDADMRRPRLAETLGMPDGRGLSTYLIGECGIDEMVRPSDIKGLDVITAGPVPPNPLELVELPGMALLFAELRKRYDHIVVDASPMGLVSEFVIIMRHTDLSLYVVRQGYTRRGALRLINDMVKDGKVERVDLLLNDVKQGHGEGYGYYTK